jgi:hypothetical protein
MLLFDPACLANTRFSYEVLMCTSNMSSSLGMRLYLMQNEVQNLQGGDVLLHVGHITSFLWDIRYIFPGIGSPQRACRVIFR